MNTEGKALREAIQTLLKKHGYKPQGTTWRFDAEETVHVVNLQKSQWGNQYYVNLGVFVKSLDSVANPKEQQCHIRGRLTDLVDDRATLETSLDFEEESVSAEQKVQTVVDALERYGSPFLTSIQSLLGMKSFLSRSMSKKFCVHIKLKRLLGIGDE